MRKAALNIATVLCLLIGLPLMVIWPCSYWRYDSVQYLGAQQTEHTVYTYPGLILYGYMVVADPDWPKVRPAKEVGWSAWHSEQRVKRDSVFNNLGSAPWLQGVGFDYVNESVPGVRHGFYFYRCVAPCWIFPALTLPLPLWRLRRWHRRRRLNSAGRCRRCGYDLRASIGRCPECGTEFEPAIQSICA